MRARVIMWGSDPLEVKEREMGIPMMVWYPGWYVRP